MGNPKLVHIDSLKMNNLIYSGTLALLVAVAGCSNCPVPNGTFSNSSAKLSAVASTGGNTKYEIRWNGAKGQELDAHYVITYRDLNKLSRSERVKAKLPHKVTFSESDVSNVVASGFALGVEKLDIKIFHNGAECSKPISVGSGATDTRICQP